MRMPLVLLALVAGCASLPDGAGRRECPDCPDMVQLSAGRFMMGSDPGETAGLGLDPYFADRERPRHQVVLTRAFGLARTEVTRGAFARFVGESGYRVPSGCWVYEGSRWRLDPVATWERPGFEQTDQEPVVCVSRSDAEAYAAWLSRSTGRSFRLPSEAEWEYAARAGGTRIWPWGDSWAAGGCRYANSGDAATQKRFGWAGQSLGIRQVQAWQPAPCDDGFATTAPVGSLKSNAWGIFDMIGNVQEWVADCQSPNHGGAPMDGRARRDGDCTKGVLKGQGWTAGPPVLRPAFRLNGAADERRFSWGFRLVEDRVR